MIIKNATLLNYEEFSLYKHFIATDFSFWWLKDAGQDDTHGCFIYGKRNSVLDDMPINTKASVRPALIVDSLVASPGDKIKIFDYSWTVLNNSLLLCDHYIGKYRFDEKTNDWYHSELKQHLDNWFLEQIEKTQEVVMVKNNTEFLLLQSLCKTHNLNKLKSKVTFGYSGNLYFIYSPYGRWRQITTVAEMPPEKIPLTFAEFCNLITGEKTDDN